ncbi:MAG: ATP-binding protein [Acidobacteriota bacterium]
MDRSLSVPGTGTVSAHQSEQPRHLGRFLFVAAAIMIFLAALWGWSRQVDEILLATGCLLTIILALAVRRDLIRREALRVRTAELQAIFKAYPDLQFRLAGDGTILDYQAESGTDLYMHMQSQEFLGRRLQEILPADIGARFDAAFTDLAHGASRASLEYQLEINGSPRHFEARVLPLGAGQMIVIARDITARKQAQERQEIFRFGVDQAALPVYWVRADGRIVYANAAACRALGYARQELESMTVHDIDPDFPEDLWESHWKVMQEKGSMTFQSHHRRRDGERFPVQITISLISHQGTEYVWAYVEDTSQRQKAETDRTRLERQLRQAQKLEAVGQLAGGIAHEFNNLLTVILGCTELMLAGGTPGEAADRSYDQNLRQIQTAVLRASDLTRQLLTFSRRNVENPTLIDTVRTIADTEKMLRHLIRENVSVDLRIDQDLEPIRAGSGRLEQVLVNLVVNALDAMPDGGHLNIDCSSVVLDAAHVRHHPGAQAGKHVRIEVRDDGVGMPPETVEHIFEPFYTTKPPGKGTGLGMATVYALVTQVGGHIAIDSTPRQGTTIQVYFPVAPEDAVKAELEARPVDRGQGETVLVCEDETTVREVVCDVLRASGYSVLSAETGRDALEKAARHPEPVAALVTDVIMPEMSGPILAEAMLAHHPGLRVLFISGYPGDLLDPATMRRHGHRFLGKPFSPADLQSSLRQIIDTTAPGEAGPAAASMRASGAAPLPAQRRA